MRRVRIFEHISLDGVIQVSADPGEGGSFPYNDWTAPYRTPAGLTMMLAAYGETFDLLLGRRTYDAGYWPRAPESPMAERLNAATKYEYVVTHRPESLRWGPCAGIGPGVAEAVRRVKAIV